tara:strand:+ start:10557 stop:10904 length:348 start_codon:yes stop_codon:yes gene_type:complete
MSTLGITNDKDYAKSGTPKTVGEDKFVPAGIRSTVGTEYQQVGNNSDYPKNSKLMQADHYGHKNSETTKNGFKASPVGTEYQQVTNNSGYNKKGNRSSFPSEGVAPSIANHPKVL